MLGALIMKDKEAQNVSNLLFQYTLLNRKVYEILENNDLKGKEKEMLASKMFLISDGIHNLTRYSALTKESKVIELTLLNKILDNINFEDRYLIDISYFLQEMKKEVKNIIERQN